MTASSATPSDPLQWWAQLSAAQAKGEADYTDSLGDQLIACVESGLIPPLEVPEVILALLRTTPAFSSLWAAAQHRDTTALDDMARAGTVAVALDSRLARFLLSNFITASPELELILTPARRALLMQFMQGAVTRHEATLSEFAATLAQQCFLNEFAYWEEPDETVWTEVLIASVEALIAEKDERAAFALAILACYRPLVPWPGDNRPSRDAFGATGTAFDAMWARVVEEPLLEREIAKALPVRGDIADEVSKAVRSLYEENPYPRWRIPQFPARRSSEATIRELFPAADLAIFPNAGRPRVLVAGCGTGFNTSRLAHQFAPLEIEGIDLSRMSLAYAKRQALSFGLKIGFTHADILALSPSDGQFDIIECAGVLHHTKDVRLAWSALTSCLAPGGLMNVALYNRNARGALGFIKQFIARGGYASTPKDIRRFRKDAMRAALQPGPLPSPLLALLTWYDFYSVSMCRDLAFHVQERDFFLREIVAMAGDLGLAFLGLSLPSEVVARRYWRSFPHDPYVRDVASFEKFERDENVSGGAMYNALFQKPLR